MDKFSRRTLLAIGATGAVAAAASHAAAATFGDPDEPAEGAINASPAALRDPGPRNGAIASQFPDSHNPPATDVDGMPQFWASFNNAHKRIQAGGWARQITQADFPISKDFAGVNMRLSAGGVRELHWHQAAEWAYMTYGQCRVTVLDAKGRPFVQDVSAGDLWFFPPGYPHSLQGLGDDGCEFIIAFDDGDASEFNTLLVTDWFAHTPPEVLAQNFGVPIEAFKSIPLHDLWIFQGATPGPLDRDQASIRSGGVPPNPFTFSLAGAPPIVSNQGGSLRYADSTTFKVSKDVAAALETIEPGGLREMHWHPNADEWQYWIKGEGRMIVFDAGPRIATQDFRAGDIGVVGRNRGHLVQNTGATELQFLALFKSPQYEEISLGDWLAHTPPALVAQHLNVDPMIFKRFADRAVGILPA